MSLVKNVVFDLGNVLINWDRRIVYRRLFDGDEDAMEHFLQTVWSMEPISRMDAGVPYTEVESDLIERFPDMADLIRAYGPMWDDMIPGVIEDSVAIFYELKNRGTPVYALSNWSMDFFPRTEKRFPFLQDFDGRILSGQEKMIKPDPAIYHLLLDRFALTPEHTLFIDDRDDNIEAAKALGIQGHLFTDPSALRQDLIRLQLLDPSV